MKKTLICTALAFLFAYLTECAATDHIFNDFIITQNNAVTGSSTVVNLIKPSPEILYFEHQSDLSLLDFTEHNDYSSYTEEIINGGISGGAADLLGITSNSALHYAGDAPGTMILHSFNGTNHVFDPIFSNYLYLVFDVQNIGAVDVNILPRIGPNSIYSNSSMYYAFDKYFNAVNARTLGAGKSATFIFGLGLDESISGDVIWDYANGPYSQFELLFQPTDGIGFDVIVDNIGFVVPEPGAFLLFGLGIVICRKVTRKTEKN